jgi:membrane-bound serine protease (ClpP class)
VFSSWRSLGELDPTLAAPISPLSPGFGRFDADMLARVLFLAGLALFLVLPSPWDVVALASGVILGAGELLVWYFVLRRRRAQVGVQTLVGATATVVSPCRPDGQVRVEGEIWEARCPAGADLGETVRITGIDGLTLVVELERQVGAVPAASGS